MLFGKRERIVNRILIVEDEPLTAFDNETMIADAGYEVVATLDRYSDAVATLDKEKVDLILCDVRLTGERSGIDLAQVAKNRGIPVLFLLYTIFPRPLRLEVDADLLDGGALGDEQPFGGLTERARRRRVHHHPRHPTSPPGARPAARHATRR